MKTLESLTDTYRLSKRDAEFVLGCLTPQEAIVTPVGAHMLNWLKEKMKVIGKEFLAATVEGQTLYMYLLTGDDSVEVISFPFIGDHPLDELWRATLSAEFNGRMQANFISAGSDSLN